MAEYLILIYEDEAATATPEDFEQALKEHTAFSERNASVLRGGHALRPTNTATSIRKDSASGFAVTDGPFVETKEGLGGYYLIDVPSLDEAIAVAKQVPAPNGGVEVRPVWTFD